ncbi:MAG: CDP-diacylglycerol--glycerol-3-phosphate 3-phosphatidyltransferase [Treponema sp.]|jgi:CDP-diacylglycerol--glycerol-3-phosphate 3-phosphatidyltransferase|nr:CDP-diacylglycerol--glycerol-3-phosphate 3-phosphatidyltransferase [Treponema sp.]
MTLADKITSARLVLAPVFFAIYLLPPLAGSQPVTVSVLWALFIVSEITDLIDGKVARKRGEVHDFGKLFDPFADVLVRISYFLCFVLDRILPAAFLLLILYREFGILFVRILMMKKGVALGARKGGKIKAVAYMAAGAAALLASCAGRLGLDSRAYAVLRAAAVVIFGVSVVLALASFADYTGVYRRTGVPKSGED